MTDDIDRAAEREAQLRADALAAHHRRAGLAGKTAADSAEFCQVATCGAPIPTARRTAIPGCQFCVDCQAIQERKTRGLRR